MEGKLKIVLQILFVVVLIWFLGALSGRLPGAGLRIGNRKRRAWPKRRFNPNTWAVSGMTGGELIASPGSNVPAVGRPVWP